MWPCTFKCGVFLVVVVSTSAQVYLKDGAPHVNLAANTLLSGSLQLSRDGRSYSSFLGIQYAKVPKRFAASELIKPEWEGVKHAVTHGPMCPQKLGLGETGELAGDEDCLYLNVFVPGNSTVKEGYPVMLWIHGGWFVVGSGSTYGPSFFMNDQNVILITINYRLGVFGFLSTGDEVIPGNNGLKDQVMALKWVQENIRQFGGNPNLVTVFGESCGGVAAHYLTLSETTHNLFHRAIALSGSSLAPWGLVPNPKPIAVKLAIHMKCPTIGANPLEIQSEEILACLRNMSQEELNKAQFEFASTWPLNLIPLFFAPVVEPVPSSSSKNIPFIVESPHTILLNRSRPLRNTPIIFGAAEHEGCTVYSGIILSQEKLIADLNSNWDTVIPNAMVIDRYFTKEEEQKVVAQKLKQFYFAGKDVSLENSGGLTDLYSDNFFHHDTFRSAMETASRGKGNVYYYQYSYPGPVQVLGGPHMPEKESKLAGHADDLQHLFTLKGMLPGLEDDIIKPGTSDEKFSKNLVRLLISFAIHGEPKHSWGNNSNRKWKAILEEEAVDAGAKGVFRINSNPSLIKLGSEKLERMSFWTQVWDKIWKDFSEKEKPRTNKHSEL